MHPLDGEVLTSRHRVWRHSRWYSACVILSEPITGGEGVSLLIRWPCGVASTRVGEASLLGPECSVTLSNSARFSRSQRVLVVALPPGMLLSQFCLQAVGTARSLLALTIASSRRMGGRVSRAFVIVDLHSMEELSGLWLTQQGCGVCTVCHRVLSSSFNGLHPVVIEPSALLSLPLFFPLVVLSWVVPRRCPTSPLPTVGCRLPSRLGQRRAAQVPPSHRWPLLGTEEPGSTCSPTPRTSSGHRCLTSPVLA